MKTERYNALSQKLQDVAQAFIYASYAIQVLIPIIEAIEQAERSRKQRLVLILKSYTLGLTFFEKRRLSSIR